MDDDEDYEDVSYIEEWRPIPGFEGLYEASSEGGVRSVSRKGSKRYIVGRVLKPRINPNGYYQVVLRRDFTNVTKTVHRLVGLTFLSPVDGKPLILHGPKGKLDNSVGNLRWGTYSENMQDKKRDGTDYRMNITHCPQGHKYSEENTLVRTTKSGAMRVCRTCSQEKQTARRERIREKGLPDGDPIHGTLNGYNTYACRCRMCKFVDSAYRARLRERRKLK